MFLQAPVNLRNRASFFHSYSQRLISTILFSSTSILIASKHEERQTLPAISHQITVSIAYPPLIFKNYIFDMDPTAPTSVNVNIITHEGNIKVAAKVDRSRLVFFSHLAAAQLAPGGPMDRRLPKGAVTLAFYAVDDKALARVNTWIETNNIKEPKQLTLAGKSPFIFLEHTSFRKPTLTSGLKIEAFDDVVLTYATGYAFRLKRELRGDDLRNAIYDYIHQGNLTCDEFVMIVEWLAFDGGLVKTAVHEVMFRFCKGGVVVPREMEQIERYARRVGMWEEMVQVKQDIRRKMLQRDQREAEAARLRGMQ